MDIDFQEYIHNDDVAYGLIDEDNAVDAVNDVNIIDEEKELFFGDIEFRNVGGSDTTFSIINNIFFFIIAVFCLGMRDKSNYLPIIGIIILLIFSFKNLEEINIDMIFTIIPSLISMICIYYVNFTTEIVLTIMLFCVCIMVLGLMGFYIISIKVHVICILIQIILAVVLMYKIFNNNNNSRNIVLQKIMDLTTIKP